MKSSYSVRKRLVEIGLCVNLNIDQSAIMIEEGIALGHDPQVLLAVVRAYHSSIDADVLALRKEAA